MHENYYITECGRADKYEVSHTLTIYTCEVTVGKRSCASASRKTV